jgi:hypothetical protein
MRLPGDRRAGGHDRRRNGPGAASRLPDPHHSAPRGAPALSRKPLPDAAQIGVAFR